MLTCTHISGCIHTSTSNANTHTPAERLFLMPVLSHICIYVCVYAYVHMHMYTYMSTCIYIMIDSHPPELRSVF